MDLEEGPRVDFARLRADRRRRVLEAMERADLDVLVLGREANARYVSGARRLYVAGTRPFAPGCVLVRSTGEVHLMSTWDEGIPAEIDRANLFALTWNPMNFVAALQQADGVADARRVGVDAMGPLFAQLLPMAMPAAELVGAEELLRDLRMHKLPDEIACIRTAVAVAEASLLASAEMLRPGVRERELLGAFDRRMTDFGLTAPAAEGTFCVTPRGRTAVPRRLVSDRVVDAADLVAMAAGVLYAGYEGSVGRTWPSSPAGAAAAARGARRWDEVCSRLVEACRPGSTGADIRGAYAASGEPLPPFPIAVSVGLGYEAPVAGSPLGEDFDRRWELAAGMVLAVTAYVGDDEGGYLGTQTVLVTDDGPEVLTTLAPGLALAD